MNTHNYGPRRDQSLAYSRTDLRAYEHPDTKKLATILHIN